MLKFKQFSPAFLALFGAGLSCYFTYAMMKEAMAGTFIGVLAFALFLQAAQYLYTLPSMTPAIWMRVVVGALYILSVAASYAYLARSADTQIARDDMARQLRAEAAARHAHYTESLNEQVHTAQVALDDDREQRAAYLAASRKQIEEGFATRGKETLNDPHLAAIEKRVNVSRETLAAAIAKRDNAMMETVEHTTEKLSLFSTIPDWARVLMLGLMASVLEAVTFASLRAIELPVKPARKRAVSKKAKTETKPRNVSNFASKIHLVGPKPVNGENFATHSQVRQKIRERHYGSRPVQSKIAAQEGIDQDSVAQMFDELMEEGVMSKKSGRYVV